MRLGSKVVRVFRTMWMFTLLAALTWGATPAPTAAASTQIDLVGPEGSGTFGKSVTPLPGGNIVVTDPTFSSSSAANVGAVYLYDGRTGALISVLTGSTTGDSVGNGTPGFDGVFVLPGGDYVVSSPAWHNGTASSAGAVTWCGGMTGCTGQVSAENSLVGTSAQDMVGVSTNYARGITVMPDGSYVVNSPYWDQGGATDVGAVTWCSGTAGCAGLVSPSNSLVGSATADNIGSSGISVLANGNYVVRSSAWNNSAGAVTWCSGTTGCTGAVSSGNSLVGSTTNDRVGNTGAIALPNGNYVVRSSNWNKNAGAVTWCSGTTGCAGTVSASNSLVGSTAEDHAGSSSPGVAVLPNGNYVVGSYQWHNSEGVLVGAATWCSGTAGCTGPISVGNSLVGSTASDWVGYQIAALDNGSYVVSSYWWDNGTAADVGAVTWCSGAAGCTGLVSAGNSLVGSTASDRIGYQIAALDNGNYVVSSSSWDNGSASDAGAVTWCNGTEGCTGPISASNSLVGSATGDQVGYGNYMNDGLVALTGGNYVVRSPYWNNGGAQWAGAVTWCSGATGCKGPVSAGNSLVGSTARDQVGLGAIALPNGNYVVGSYAWSRSLENHEGAVTWCRGTTGCTGLVSAANSLVGIAAGDSVGYTLFALVGGGYLVRSPVANNGAVLDAGAVSWCSEEAPCIGPISAANTVLGASQNMGTELRFAFDYINNQLVVGRPADERVTLLKMLNHAVYLPMLCRE